ncbi:DUF2920 family protein, partial [Campylobacter insulaenigrae]|uniref:DUF2920 family protein n=1 Tax=Campylobacter insulaenigrae TaxID=260714 RepID=UPI002152D510
RSNSQKYNASTIFTEYDLPHLKLVLEHFNLQTSKLDTSTALIHYDALNQTINDLKEKNLLSQDYQAHFSATFIPPNNEYQNYGIMAAIDHINALKDILNKYPQFKTLPKIYGGGSYGGYLALMCAKIAPWYVDGVIDNSGAALPPLHYIVGRDMNVGDCSFNDPNIFVHCFLKTHWTRKNPNSPYYFADENYLIRALLNQTHLILQAQKNKDIVYISYHSLVDEFKTADDKKSLYEIYQSLNYNATLYMIANKKDIDGRFIKSLEHGLRMSDKALFNKELPNMLEKLKGKEFGIREDSISYPCKDKVFTFKDKDDKFVLELN